MEFPGCRRWDRDPRNELLGGLGWEYPWCSSQDWDGRNESGLRAQGHAMGAEGGRRDAGRAQGHAMGCRGEVGLGSVEPAALGLEGNAKLPLPPFFVLSCSREWDQRKARHGLRKWNRKGAGPGSDVALVGLLGVSLMQPLHIRGTALSASRRTALSTSRRAALSTWRPARGEIFEPLVLQRAGDRRWGLG